MPDTPPAPPAKSSLPFVGIVLLLLGISNGFIADYAKTLDPGTLRRALLLLADAARLSVGGGIGCIVVGLVQNRKLAREAQANQGG